MLSNEGDGHNELRIRSKSQASLLTLIHLCSPLLDPPRSSEEHKTMARNDNQAFPNRPQKPAHHGFSLDRPIISSLSLLYNSISAVYCLPFHRTTHLTLEEGALSVYALMKRVLPKLAEFISKF